MSEPCQTCECVVSHIWMSHDTLRWLAVMHGDMARQDMYHIITWHVMTCSISSHRHGTSWDVPCHHMVRDVLYHHMDIRHIITSWHTAHSGDQTGNIWISRSARFPGRSFGWREPNLLRWNLDWNCGQSRENVFDACLMRVWCVWGLQWKLVGNVGCRDHLRSGLLRVWSWRIVTWHMGWLHLVGSIKLWVSFAKEPYKRDAILQKRPEI